MFPMCGRRCWGQGGMWEGAWGAGGRDDLPPRAVEGGVIPPPETKGCLFPSRSFLRDPEKSPGPSPPMPEWPHLHAYIRNIGSGLPPGCQPC